MTMPDPKAIAAGLPQNERRVLKQLDPHIGYPAPHIAQRTKLKTAVVRDARKCLRDKGLAVITPGFDDDGNVAGSYYYLTPLGLAVKEALTDG